VKRFVVIVTVEAEDAVQAIEAAGDVFANMEAVHAMAATGEITVRPARRQEALD